MGIKELWPILIPYCERKPLYELQGKTVAIDLAGWICESLCVVDYNVQAKNYLRNLFFRTCYLLLSGVTPVFVLEGEAPALKYDMISKRNEIQFRGAKPRKEPVGDEVQKKKKENKGRSRFNYVLKQCAELLRSMGLQCVQGPGEAEAFCAHLNAAKMVDGVISQDSDCFAYGALRVYRNFSVSTQGNSSAAGGAVDVYDLEVIQRTLDIGQNKMIAMALLCGCDYCPEGVGGVGRDAVTKLFSIYSEKEILERLKSWRSNDSKYTSLEMKVSDKSICVNCGHYGRLQKHSKSGCDQCRMHVGCDASKWRDQRLAIKTELQIRKKSMEIDTFPSQEIIDEFKKKPEKMTNLDLNWKQPNLVKFLKIMSSQLQWEEIYCFQKVLPLLTRWQLFHYGSGNQNLPLRGNVWPDFIKKKRAPKGIASYEIIWKDDQNCFQGLIPDDQIETFLSSNNFKEDTDGLHSLWSTIEPIDLVEKAYPALVDTFLNSKAKKPKQTKKIVEMKAKNPDANPRKASKRTKKSTDTSLNDMSELKKVINELDDSGKKQIPVKKKRALKNSDAVPSAGLQTLDKFFLSKPKVPSTDSLFTKYNSPKIKTCSTPMNLSKFNFDLDESDVDDSMSSSYKQNLSEVIKDMVSRAPKVTEFGGKKLRFDDVYVSGLDSAEQRRDPISDTENLQFDDNILDVFDHHKNDSQNDSIKENRNFDISHLDFDSNEPPDPMHCSFQDKAEKFTESKTLAGEISLDEFDLIVMKKIAVSKLRPNLLKIQKDPSNDSDTIKSSTPVLIDRFLNKHSLNSGNKMSNVAASSGEPKTELVSSFFHSISEMEDDKIDVFEQSIDFKNMDDILPCDANDDNNGSSSDSSTIELLDSSDEDAGDKLIERAGENKAWDLSISLGDNYIPISNAMKRAQKKESL